MGAALPVDNSSHATARVALQALSPWLLRTSLALLRAALRTGATLDDLLARHPALHDSLDAAGTAGLAELTIDEALARLDLWLELRASTLREAPAAGPGDSPRTDPTDPPGPLDRLRAALGLNVDGLCCFVAAALPDSDARLAPLFDDLHGRGGRPGRACLTRVFGAETTAAALQVLRASACLSEVDHALVAHGELWDLACGLPAPRALWRHRPAGELARLDDLILPPLLRAQIDAARRRAALGDTSGQCWMLRGCAGSGRRALAGALARELGLGLVEAAPQAPIDSLGAAAALLGALPLLSLDPAPGECLRHDLPPWMPRLLVRLPRHGALVVDPAEALRIDLDPPDAAERRLHWIAARSGREPDADLLALRLPRGALHRAARVLRSDPPDPLTSLLAEIDEQGRHALDGVARRVTVATADEPLALRDEASEEFDALVARCRHRDRLAELLPAAFGQADGVRALFKGPSGTGKTLAARHLAAALRRPLYRVDLAATVSKYIGETERNLERVFAAAEALDIVLLLDEGDALLAGRTGVSNATDRYANLETNYLLQRLELYSGVLVVTTNAAERIDGAFARRMDVTIEFALPDAETRLELWLAHLGEPHALSDAWLDRVALRCALSGGQIRNACLHATLLAIDRGTVLGADALCRALEREYHKAGQHCPSLDEGD